MPTNRVTSTFSRSCRTCIVASARKVSSQPWLRNTGHRVAGVARRSCLLHRRVVLPPHAGRAQPWLGLVRARAVAQVRLRLRPCRGSHEPSDPSCRCRPAASHFAVQTHRRGIGEASARHQVFAPTASQRRSACRHVGPNHAFEGTRRYGPSFSRSLVAAGPLAWSR